MTKTDIDLHRAARIALMGFAALVLANCASPRHRIDAEYRPAPATSFVVSVQSGDTVSQIAERYRVNVEDIVAMNNITNLDRIAVGDQLYIPAYGMGRAASSESTRMASASPAATPARSSAPTAAARPSSSSIERTPLAAPQAEQIAYSGPSPSSNSRPATTTAPVSSGTFIWPINGRVLSDFGAGANGERNDGINIAGARGTPFRAAAAGTVTYVGNELRGFGNLLLIRHDNGFVTAYAHADQITVARGERVEAGQFVGYLGATGDVTEPQLHFEIRQGTRPVDPTAHLTLVPLNQASLTPRDPAKS